MHSESRTPTSRRYVSRMTSSAHFSADSRLILRSELRRVDVTPRLPPRASLIPQEPACAAACKTCGYTRLRVLAQGEIYLFIHLFTHVFHLHGECRVCHYGSLSKSSTRISSSLSKSSTRISSSPPTRRDQKTTALCGSARWTSAHSAPSRSRSGASSSHSSSSRFVHVHYSSLISRPIFSRSRSGASSSHSSSSRFII